MARARREHDEVRQKVLHARREPGAGPGRAHAAQFGTAHRELLRQQKGEAVEVVDEEHTRHHDVTSASARRSCASLCSVSANSFSGIESCTIPAPARAW